MKADDGNAYEEKKKGGDDEGCVKRLMINDDGDVVMEVRVKG